MLVLTIPYSEVADFAVLDFSDAIDKASSFKKRHLLLGNGFSIACRPDIFSYGSLLDEADFTKTPELPRVFEALGTSDFEYVVDVLLRTTLVLPLYSDAPSNVVDTMKAHAEALKELLIGTVAGQHPPFPGVIDDEAYDSCVRFISNFLGKQGSGSVYTLNYDLLLYWTLMRSREISDNSLIFNDGFDRDGWFEDGEWQQSSELYWQGNTSNQNLYYLHGALHLYQGEGRIEKFSWTDTSVRLIEQARRYLDEGKFPLFVSEANSDKKLSKIHHNPYLFAAYKSFQDVANGGRGRKPGDTCLFTFGVSFGENDEHITKALSHGRIRKLFVGIYGNPDSDENQEVVRRLEYVKEQREGYPLDVSYYHAETAQVWDGLGT